MTRGFINFSYFAAIFLAVIVAYVLRMRERAVIPFWFWITPIFFVAKPVLLIFLPLMGVAALKSPRRFRWITLISAAMAASQFIRMLFSYASGNASAYSGSERLPLDSFLTACKYVFGQLGGVSSRSDIQSITTRRHYCQLRYCFTLAGDSLVGGI